VVVVGRTLIVVVVDGIIVTVVVSGVAFTVVINGIIVAVVNLRLLADVAPKRREVAAGKAPWHGGQGKFYLRWLGRRPRWLKFVNVGR
jgi:hypothetical protein